MYPSRTNSLDKALYQRLRSGAGRIFLHFFFWMAVLLINPVAFSPHWGTFRDLLFDEAINLPHKIAFCYVFMYLLIPSYLLAHQYFRFLLWTVLSFAALYIIRNQTYIITENWIYGYDFPQGYFPPAKVLRGVYRDLAIIAIASMVKLIKIAFQNQLDNQSLRQEKLEAELKFLKGQLHPHFLFNTLNNLYVLSLKKSDLAPEAILTLSDLLDYILYECNAETVPLEKEIRCIEDYIRLEQLRYGKRLEVRFDKPDVLPNKAIPPLMLLPFVENAFKHGTSDTPDQVCIYIKLEIISKRLFFKVENSKSPFSSEDFRRSRQGIGLKNMQKRLELLYKDKHQLKTEDLGDQFRAELLMET